jgi:hypothetical protein
LNAYEEYNKFLRNVHNKESVQNAAALGERISEVMGERTSILNEKEGESLSIDDISDIYIQVMGEQRGKTNMTLTTKSKTGEINDYLEVRRPFGAAQ